MSTDAPAAEKVSEDEAVGKTVASVKYRSAEADDYGEEIVVAFTDGTELVIWGCGCCSSPSVVS